MTMIGYQATDDSCVLQKVLNIPGGTKLLYGSTWVIAFVKAKALPSTYSALSTYVSLDRLKEHDVNKLKNHSLLTQSCQDIAWS